LFFPCKKLANITEVINLDNSEVKVLSCGHRLHKTAPAVENVPIADQAVRSKHITRNIIEDPQLASSKEIKIEARNLDDKIPVTVSGDSGVRTEGLLDPNFSLQKEGSAYIT
jgi:hypothetical protein